MSTDIEQACGSLGNARKNFLRNVTFHYRTYWAEGSHQVCFSLLNREVSDRTRGLPRGARVQRSAAFPSLLPFRSGGMLEWTQTRCIPPVWRCAWGRLGKQAGWLSLNASPSGQVCGCSINPRAAFHSAGLGLRAAQVEPTLRAPCLLLRFLSGIWTVSSRSLTASPPDTYLPWTPRLFSLQVWHMLS